MVGSAVDTMVWSSAAKQHREHERAERPVEVTSSRLFGRWFWRGFEGSFLRWWCFSHTVSKLSANWRVSRMRSARSASDQSSRASANMAIRCSRA